MRDFTNLAWPETPFGANQRPYGRRAHMLAAVDVIWGHESGRPIPRCASVVYLRVQPTCTLSVTPVVLPIGFRATVLETTTDLDELLEVFDRALVRARRHAYLLAGHRLERQLNGLALLSPVRRPGIATVLATSWSDVRARGMARLHGISDDLTNAAVDVDLDTEPSLDDRSAVTIAAEALARCLAIALVAGRHAGLVEWDGTFATRQAIAAAGWDVLDQAADPARP